MSVLNHIDFIQFIFPGFIALKCYELLYPVQPQDTSKKIIDIVSYSSVVYLLHTPFHTTLSESIFSQNYPITTQSITIIFLIITPVILVWIWKFLRESSYFQKHAPHPTLKSWDYIFSTREPFYIIATLNDDKKLAGLYGHNSFASSSPASPELYLEQSWHINEHGGFEEVKKGTRGIFIAPNQIKTLELYKATDNEE